MLPADLQFYLSNSSNLKHQFEEGELREVELYAADEITKKSFDVDTYDFYLQGEFDKDPEQRFEFEGYNLVKKCKGYSSDGILAWFPTLSSYGAWDCDHHKIFLFPRLTWTDISADLMRYLSAQWFPELVAGEYLRPWTQNDKEGRVSIRDQS